MVDDYDDIPEFSSEDLDLLANFVKEDSKFIPIPEPVVSRQCFICDEPLKDGVDGNDKCLISYPPSGAIMFTSRGNWGSSLFDPGNTPEVIEIAICDRCVYDRRAKVGMFIRTTDLNTRYKYVECETFEEHVKNWPPFDQPSQ